MEMLMPQMRRLLRHWKRERKIIKARYEKSTHFTAFDICAIRRDGKRTKTLRRGTLQGANRREITKMLTGMAEAFSCREIELESVGGAGLASIEIIAAKAHQSV
jgi:hypothetical protein